MIAFLAVLLILSPVPNPRLGAMQTPCEKICIVDAATGLCRGCGRSLDEITRWTQYSDGERTRIMAELPPRLEAMRARDGGSVPR